MVYLLFHGWGAPSPLCHRGPLGEGPDTIHPLHLRRGESEAHLFCQPCPALPKCVHVTALSCHFASLGASSWATTAFSTPGSHSWTSKGSSRTILSTLCPTRATSRHYSTGVCPGRCSPSTAATRVCLPAVRTSASTTSIYVLVDPPLDEGLYTLLPCSRC